jgi:hypothetical protein
MHLTEQLTPVFSALYLCRRVESALDDFRDKGDRFQNFPPNFEKLDAIIDRLEIIRVVPDSRFTHPTIDADIRLVCADAIDKAPKALVQMSAAKSARFDLPKIIVPEEIRILGQ